MSGYEEKTFLRLYAVELGRLVHEGVDFTADHVSVRRPPGLAPQAAGEMFRILRGFGLVELVGSVRSRRARRRSGWTGRWRPVDRADRDARIAAFLLRFPDPDQNHVGHAPVGLEGREER